MRIPHGLRAALASQAAPIAPTDPNFNLVSLLLHGDGTNGAQNNTFLDGSTNNFTITRVGNTTQGTFSPFSPTGWSGYFDGTGDYLGVARNTAFDFGTDPFTMECFVYLSSLNAEASIIFGKTQSSNLAGIAAGMSLSNSGEIFFLASNNSGYNVLVSGGTLSLNRWYHLAFVRSGNSFYGFVDGVLSATATNSNAISNDTTGTFGGITMGAYSSAYGGNAGRYPLNGHMSNLRVVKGTAVYTSNFTPPTSPLTAITNTSLLTLQDNRFKDNSTNNFTITRNGDTKIEAFSPFNPTAAYSASTHGGSAYLDGTGDYLTTAASNENNFGTSDFTIEFWINSTKTTRSDPFGWNYSYSNAGWAGFVFNLSSSGDMAWYENTNSRISASATGWNNGAWNHVALTRNGNSVRMFLNGTQVGSTYTTSFSYGANSSGFIVGDIAGGGGPVNGYISGLRVLKGIAQYTSNFTPPTAPLTAITNTSLLLNFTNGGIIDNASKNVLETVGNAQISTSVKKFGTGSMYFDGTGDYVIGPANTNLNWGTGDFTVELWANIISSDSFGTLFNTEVYSQQSQANTFALYTTSTLQVVAGTYGVSLVTSTAISANTWTHIAVTRQGTSFRLFINGVLIGTATNSTNFIAGGFTIGALPRAVSVTEINGYIDDLRVTKGVARYTANFTPPTQAFPDL